MRYSGFLLISSLVVVLSCTPSKIEERPVEEDLLAELDSLSHSSNQVIDSVLKVLAQSKDSLDEGQALSIHLLLQKIINEKAAALAKLDAINSHMDSIEYAAKEYVSKKKASKELRQRLLNDIQKLKHELNEIRPRTLNEIEQKPIPNQLKSLIELPAGNYRARIDKHHILQFFVSDAGEIFVAPLILDSTTVFTGPPMNPKVAEQIQKIKESLKN